MIHLLKKISVSFSRALEAFRSNKFFNIFNNNGGKTKDVIQQQSSVASISSLARHQSNSIWYVSVDEIGNKLGLTDRLCSKYTPLVRNQIRTKFFANTYDTNKSLQATNQSQKRNKFIVNDSNINTSPYAKFVVSSQPKDVAVDRVLTPEESKEKLSEFWRNLRRQKQEWAKYNLQSSDLKERGEATNDNQQSKPIKFEFKYTCASDWERSNNNNKNNNDKPPIKEETNLKNSKPAITKFEFKLPPNPKWMQCKNTSAEEDEESFEESEDETPAKLEIPEKKPIKFKFKPPRYRFDDIIPKPGKKPKEEKVGEKIVEDSKDEKLVNFHEMQLKKLHDALKSQEDKRMISFKSTSGLSYGEIVERAKQRKLYDGKDEDVSDEDKEFKNNYKEAKYEIENKAEPEVLASTPNKILKHQKKNKKDKKEEPKRRLLCVEQLSDSEGPTLNDIWEEPLENVFDRQVRS